MKKRNLLNTKKMLRLCIGFLLVLVVLTTHYDFGSSRRPECTPEYVCKIVVSSAGSQAGENPQNTITRPEWTRWNVMVLVPAELAVDDRTSGLTAANYSTGALSPSASNPPGYIVAVDVPEPEPLPVFLYSLFVAAFGLVGFFVAAPAASGPLPQHRSPSGYRSY